MSCKWKNIGFILWTNLRNPCNFCPGVKIATPSKILVTAFGPFAGRAENASSLALQGLKKHVPEIGIRTLPVDSVIAPSRLKQALKTIRPDVLLMLGEAAGSKSLRFEMTAWNVMDFNIPDIAGRQPRLQAIVASGADFLKPTLPVAEIHACLVNEGRRVSLSEDAGRYLCNQLFYTALHWIESQKLACRAGFIHLPLRADCRPQESVDNLVRVLELLQKFTLGIQRKPPNISR